MSKVIVHKYIRTKNGIFRGDKAHDGHIVGLWNPEVKILKEADTIEELCDGFYIEVCEPIFEKNFIYSKEEYYDFHYVITQCLKENNVKYTAYGFIKTNKGLIYVAKMNSEGKLCLI